MLVEEGGIKVECRLYQELKVGGPALRTMRVPAPPMGEISIAKAATQPAS